MSKIKANLLHLLMIRWLTLLHTAVLYLLGMKIGSVLLFTVLIFYCFFLTLFWERVTIAVKKKPLLLQVDLIISGIAIWLTGGTWQSPYYVYAFTSLMIVAFLSHIKGGLLAAIYFSVLYTIGLFANKGNLSLVVANNDLDSLISNYFAFLLVAVFFGIPAHIIQHIQKVRDETAQTEERLHSVQEAVEAAKDTDSLSCRELEVLSMLNTGKTNSQIAEELHVSEKTVKNHLWRIYKKIGVSSRPEAVLYFNSKYAHTRDKGD